MAKRTQPPVEKKKNKTIVVLLVLIIVALLLGGAAGYYFLVYQPAHQAKQVKGGQREAAALQGSLQVMTEEEIQEALNHIVEEGMFRISIASNIIAIEDGMAEMRIENNMTNRYVMQVDILLDETKDVIYSTALIDPGYYIQEAQFDKHLDPGEYNATAIFTALYPDTEDVVGTAGANVKIHVFAKGVPLPTATPEPTPEPTAEPTEEPTLDLDGSPTPDEAGAPKPNNP